MVNRARALTMILCAGSMLGCVRQPGRINSRSSVAAPAQAGAVAGNDEAPSSSGQAAATADDLAVGVVLPLSGRGREAGQQALRVLQQTAANTQPPLVLHSVDDGGEANRSLEQLRRLAADPSVVAVIGPLHSAGVQATTAALGALQLPLLPLTSLDRTHLPADAAPWLHTSLPTPAQEASMLLREAARRGAKRLVVMHPETNFGRAMGRAFEHAAGALPFRSVQTIAYGAAATSFHSEAQRLQRGHCDAVVIADRASILELIAPAIAALDGESKPLLLVPGIGFHLPVMQRSGRYLQGALFSLPSSLDLLDAAAADRPDAFAWYAHQTLFALQRAMRPVPAGQRRSQLAAALEELPPQTALFEWRENGFAPVAAAGSP